MNNNKRKGNKYNNRRRSRKLKPRNAMLSNISCKSSILGKTLPRELDVLVPVYAVNNLGTPFYSFGTSTAAPVMSVNISGQALTQFAEYSQLVRTYGLIQLKSVHYKISRASSLINNVAIIGNTPNIFLQTSLTNYGAGSVTLQQTLATADNTNEINLQTYDSYSVHCQLPPCMSSRSTLANDIFCFGSSTWTPTVINGVQTLPELFLNLGSLLTPSFQTGAASTAYLIANIHVKIAVVFAGPQSL